MAGIVDGNPVNASYTNTKLASKDGDNTFIGKQTLNRSGSGGTITDLQQTVNDNTADILLKIDLSEKGAANGVAELDATGKIPSSQLTVSIMEYLGTWNASTNSPSLADGTGSSGDTYRVSVAGSQDLGSGSISYSLGDYVIYNGSTWEKADTTDTVNSVNGQTGAVSLGADDLSDVTISGAATRDVLKYNGSVWENLQLDSSANDAATGANVTLSAVSTSVIRLTNGSLTSIDMIPAGFSAQWFILINRIGASITINNDTGGTAANRIYTGTGANLTLSNNAALILSYDSTTSRWNIVGGSGSAGANTSLSNLIATSINQNLSFDGDDTRSIGAVATRVAALFSSNISISDGADIQGRLINSVTTPSGISITFGVQVVKKGIPGGFITPNNTDADATATGSLYFETGNKTAGTGNSGDLNFRTGTSSGGTRGKLNFNTNTIDINSTKIVNVSDPTSAQDAATKNYVDSNSGGKNYISNGKANVNTTGWITYQDAAGVAPVDGTGGSPGVTWSRSTTTPLSGDADFNFTKPASTQGEGVAYDFTLDRADLGHILTISFDAENITTPNGPESGDLTCWIYDVTNSIMIQPSGYEVMVGTIGIPIKNTMTFQAPSNSTSLRFIIHTSTTTSNSWAIAFDNLIISPQYSTQGASITDWVSYTPTFTGFGTVSTQNSYWRRIGDSLEFKSKFTSGTPTATEARISLPSGITTSSTIPTLEVSGKGNQNSSSTTNFSGLVVLSEPSVTYLTFGAETSTINGLTKQNGNSIVSVGSVVSLFAKIPIAGWGSNVIVSDSASTRIVAAKYYLSSNNSPGANGAIAFNTRAIDTHNALNTSTGAYVIPVPGIYRISAALASTGGGSNVKVYKNGAAIAGPSSPYIMVVRTDTSTECGDTLVDCVAGDSLTIVSESAVTYQSASSSATVQLLSGPSQIAASEKILAKASGDPASASASNPIIFPTSNIDTHGGYSTSTGRFTVMAPGYFRVSGYILSANAGIGLSIYKNGSSDTSAGATDSNGEGNYNGIVSCIVGDILDIRPNGTLDCGSGSTIYFERI